MSKFIEELKRRNVIKAAIAYVVVAWVILQVLSIVLPSIGAPEWVMKTLMILMVIGFPVWVLISWVYEVTPEGLKKTKKNTEDRGISEVTNKRLNILILIGLVIAIAVGFFNKPALAFSSENGSTNFDKSIAVLPFDDMSSGGDTEWFCNGVTEDILTNLSKLKELKVISRTSTERYKDTDKSIPEIARELGVSYVVEGSVRKYENKVIITAQLIDANDTHLWAQNYNDDFEEVFKIQQDVSQKIVDQLKIAISPAEEQAMTKLPTNNLDAYNLVLKGRGYIEKGTKNNIEIGIGFLTQATELDTEYADAFAELAYANLLRMYYENNDSWPPYLQEATKYNTIALSLDPNSVRANSTKGLIMTEADRKEDRLKAEGYFNKALQLNPNDAISHLEISIFYSQQKNDLKKGLYHARRAFELNPFHFDVIYTFINHLMDNELFNEAEKVYEDNKLLLTDNARKNLKASLVDKEVELLMKKSADYNSAIELYTKSIEEDPNSAYLNHAFGAFYDNYMNDDINAIKYLYNAQDLDSTNGFRLRAYHNILCEGRKFEEAIEYINSDRYKKYTSDVQKAMSNFYYYYHSENYIEAKKILLSDSLLNTDVHLKVLLFSQLGEKEKVYTIFKTEEPLVNSKVFGFAILEQRDSLYHYFDTKEVNALWFNSRREFDPYRKDDQYIALMKKHGLPILEKYNGSNLN